MSDLVGSVTSVSPVIGSGESYGVNLLETNTFGGSYAPINGNPSPPQCGGNKKRRGTSKRKNKKNRKSKKNLTMKRKTAKKMRKNKKRKN